MMPVRKAAAYGLCLPTIGAVAAAVLLALLCGCSASGWYNAEREVKNLDSSAVVPPMNRNLLDPPDTDFTPRRW